MCTRPLFPRAARGGYLDSAAEGLPAPGVADAVAEYLAEKARGTPGRLRHFAVEHEARVAAAALLGSEADDTVFLPSASDALNIFVTSIPWKTGDRVVTTDLEFPSNVLPWLALGERGVEVVVVPSREGALELDDLKAAINEHTRVVTISQVSYKTGAWFPHTAELAEAVHAVGGLLCVDATQALGRCRVPLAGVDYLVASTFKWLLSLHGSAITYMSPHMRGKFSLAGVGWYSVSDVFSERRFSEYTLKEGAACLVAGMPNFSALYGVRASLEFLNRLNLPQEQSRTNALARNLRSRLASFGLEMLTPADERFTSGIVSFSHAGCLRIMTELDSRGIVVWGGDGRVRASLHYYNDESDVDDLLTAIQEVLSL